MKRTLGGRPTFRACLRRSALGADRTYTGVSTDSRTIARGRTVRRAPRPQLQRQQFRGGRREGGRRRRRRGCASTPVAICADHRAQHAEGAGEGFARVARKLWHPARRRRGQQRQDHRQRNDRDDSRAGRHLPRDARQSQQSHRRAAHALPARCAIRSSPSSRWARTRRARSRCWWRSVARPWASSRTLARSISKASAVSKAPRAPKARWSRALRRPPPP